ncbi:MAG: DUF4145 domain-containing protein [Planctomycetes bacterium]|nr:DUF4145 domain-containing protein [Planctomycetota bacterium]
MSSTSHAARKINAVSVETPQGLRTFELYAGDIFADASDLLVISASPREERAPAGSLVEQLRDQYGLEPDLSHSLVSFGDLAAFVQKGNESTPFGDLLTMRIPPPRSQLDPVEFYDRAIRLTFAAVASLEFLGKRYPRVSLPILVRQGIDAYAPAVHSLLRHAIAWLRQSRHTCAIGYYVYHPEELDAWDGAMNACLGRTFVDAHGDSVLNGLCRGIVGALDGGALTGGLADLSASLRRALADPERLCVQTIAAFGRKLAELLTEQLCREFELSPGRDLMANIEALRTSGALAPWISSYLHLLRVFGNEAVHAQASRRRIVPSQLAPEDLLSLVSAVAALLRFWRTECQGGSFSAGGAEFGGSAAEARQEALAGVRVSS